MKNKINIAECITEEPIHSRFTMWRWDMEILHTSWPFGCFKLYIWMNPDKLIKSSITSLDHGRMSYDFQTFEEAYEWMISFLEAIENWKTFTYDVED